MTNIFFVSGPGRRYDHEGDVGVFVLLDYGEEGDDQSETRHERDRKLC